MWMSLCMVGTTVVMIEITATMFFLWRKGEDSLHTHTHNRLHRAVC